LCDERLSNFNPSIVASVIFDVIVDNWHPAIYPDTICNDEDYVQHLFGLVINTNKSLDFSTHLSPFLED
jgi:hypothetical protein